MGNQKGTSFWRNYGIEPLWSAQFLKYWSHFFSLLSCIVDLSIDGLGSRLPTGSAILCAPGFGFAGDDFLRDVAGLGLFEAFEELGSLELVLASLRTSALPTVDTGSLSLRFGRDACQPAVHTHKVVAAMLALSHWLLPVPAAFPPIALRCRGLLALQRHPRLSLPCEARTPRFGAVC